MKNLKVKSAFFSLIALLTISFFMTSCEQETVEIPTPSHEDRVEQLESDANYIKINELNQELLGAVRHAMITKNVSAEDMKNMYRDSRHDLLNDFFAGTGVAEIMDEIAPLAEQLTADYSDLIPASQGFDASAIDGWDNVQSMTDIENRCGWQYYVCLGTASAAYGACIAGTAGWGIFACYAAYVGTVALCFDSYC